MAHHVYAGVAELADAPDLGSGAARRGGSSPFTRTFAPVAQLDRVLDYESSG
jgi:hypothetical protein